MHSVGELCVQIPFCESTVQCQSMTQARLRVVEQNIAVLGHVAGV